MSSISSIQSSELDDLVAAKSYGTQSYWNNFQNQNSENELSVESVNNVINEVCNSQGSSPDFSS
ncbi:MAG: hypothetical protein FJZ57_01905 [Chlamydiae bacterium]|nr:hypothetical protein [Chlamydiota bacterium]